MSSVILRLSDVAAGYDGHTIVSHVSLDVMDDSFIAIVGPNGGGKTTILRVMLSQLRPTHGSLWTADGLKIGYMPQMFDADRDFPISVRDVVLMGQTGGGLFVSRSARQRADELIEFAELGAVADRRIGQLSGGQRQRVMLCRALMMRPKLLILDEPVTYMDRHSETTLYNLLPELHKQMAIVLVSHDVGTVTGMAKNVASVNGTLEYFATADLRTNPLQAFGCPMKVLMKR